MITKLDDLRNEGWRIPDGSFVVCIEDVEDYVFKLKFDFEQRLANAVNEAYDEGYEAGLLNGVHGG